MKEIKRLDVVSVATILGVLYAILGLIFGIIFAIVGTATMGIADLPSGLGLFFGAGAIIFLPIFYGILGFIVGAIVAFFYNIIAGRIGGIKMELG